MNKKLTYSFDGENYNGEYDTIELLIEDLIGDSCFTDRIEEDKDSTIIFIGESNPYSDCGSNAYDAIIDHFREAAYDVGGEFAEYYLDTINPEHQKFLEDKLDIIWEEFKKLANEEDPFFTVSNALEYRIYTDGKYEILEDKKCI